MGPVFRIRRRAFLAQGPLVRGMNPPRTQQADSPTPGVALYDSYFSRLLKLIPSEVIALYLVGRGVIPEAERSPLAAWAAICLLGVIAVRAVGTRGGTNRLPVQWAAVAIAAGSFVVWVYSMGDAFKAYGLYEPYLGSLLVLSWTFFVPILYHGE